MVSLVLVSHSKKLALAARALIRQVSGPDVKIAIASGVGKGHEELGTDAVHIAQVLRKTCQPDGALVLMDLGSAVLSAETALELLEPEIRKKVRLCAAPLVEGALAAAVQASTARNLDTVCAEAHRALAAKQQQLSPAEMNFPEDHVVGEAAEIVVTVQNEHGLHARPAANLVRALSRYSSDIQISNESNGRGPASARSLTSLSLLQAENGHRLRIRAVGEDRVAAIAEVSGLAARKFGEQPGSASSIPVAAEKRKMHHRGIPAADGIAIGSVQLLEPVPVISEEEELFEDPTVELEKLRSAMKSVRNQISQRLGPENYTNEILQAQALILDDPVLMQKLKSLLDRKRATAARAWIEATTELSALYQGMNDEYLRARTADVRDIAQRVLRELMGEKPNAIPLDHPAILFTCELLASEAALCDPENVLGVISREGSPTAHSAIVLRTRGIPMVVGVDWLDEAFVAGKSIAFDGATGEVWTEPSREVITMLSERKRRREAERVEALHRLQEPSVMIDGIRVEVLANVGSVSDAAAAADNGAEGIGLLRSEFLFLSRDEAPSESQQAAALGQIFSAIPGTIIVRTLDVGADKPLRYLSGAKEQNPFLGVRGIRVSLQHPQFFITHLRAILTAALGKQVWLMLPMISVVDEIRRTRELICKAHEQLEAEGRAHLWPIKLGIMIEVPSAALMAEQLAEEAEFFSIGTNDLTQYVMAVERGSATLSALQDALHPAVLKMIKAVVDGACGRERHVSICGDAASDPLAALIFAGLGVRSLSVRPNQLAEIKDLFRRVRSSELADVAVASLGCSDAESVRALARAFTHTPEPVK